MDRASGSWRDAMRSETKQKPNIFGVLVDDGVTYAAIGNEKFNY